MSVDGRLRPSAADHAEEDAIPAHKMMVERSADMRGRKAGNRDAGQRVKGEKTVGEYAVLRPDRRQLEPAEDDDRRSICRCGDPAGKRLHDEKRVERPMGR